MSNIAPFFIVEELGPSVAFYVRAGFDVRYSAPAQDPFFAIVARDETRIFLKQITGDVLPLPNPIRHHWAPWDAFVSVEHPDTLAAEFAEANIAFRMKLVHSILKQRVHSKHKLSESQMLLSATLGKFMR